MPAPEFFDDLTVRNLDAALQPPAAGHYENSVFEDCSFRQSDLKSFTFQETTFRRCDLSLARLHQTWFRDAVFEDCKLVGMPFDRWADARFACTFVRCNLDLALFRGSMLRKCRFVQCTFRETDFSGADAGTTLFDRCDFTGARFDGTNLEEADLLTSSGFVLDPAANKIRGAVIAAASLPGLLAAYGPDIR